MANTAVQPGRPDPRARFVDFGGLDWDLFPPLNEWTDDHWRDAICDSPAAIPPGQPHADPRLAQIDFRELALDRFPPISDWSDTHYDLAVQQTRAAREQRATALPERPYEEEQVDLDNLTPNERLCLIDFDLLLLDQFPPIADWHNEHWWQAITITHTDWLIKHEPAAEGEWITLEDQLAEEAAPRN